MWLQLREPQTLQSGPPVTACTQEQATALDPAPWVGEPVAATLSVASSDGFFGEADREAAYRACPCAKQGRNDWRFLYWDCRCSRSFRFDAVERALAARAAEPKRAWACEMEQRLLSRLTTAELTARFVLTSIDCRSADCRILARGVQPDANELFRASINRIIADETLRLSSNVATGYGRSDSGTVHLYALVRRRPLSEMRASRAQ